MTIKRQPAEDIGNQANNQSVQAKPLTDVAPTRFKGVGRPAKLVMPPMPLMPMSSVEQDIFNYFIDAYNEQFPDLTPVDQLTLFLAGIEFVKYLRVAREELETGKVITMSRQHPGVNMRALLDQLSVTRKARTAHTKPDEDPEAKELREFFMGMSTKK
jgi:hypothetical protein